MSLRPLKYFIFVLPWLKEDPNAGLRNKDSGYIYNEKRPKSSGNNPQCVCSSRTPAQFLCSDCPLRSVVFLLLGDIYISVLIPPHVSAILLETRDATVSTFPSTGWQKHLHHSNRRVTEKHDHMSWRTNCVLSVTCTPLLSHTQMCTKGNKGPGAYYANKQP